MSDAEQKAESYAENLLAWARVSANVVDDVSRGLISFIPSGLGAIYDGILKPFPLLGKLFSLRVIEQPLKMVSGITIGKGIASDIAHYLFRPVGYLLGMMLGGLLASKKKAPRYQGTIGKILNGLAGQTVGGSLLGMLSYSLFTHFAQGVAWQAILPQELSMAAAIGAVVGLSAKGFLLFAVHSVNSANAAAVRKNVQRAKELNAKLKSTAKQKAKGRILMHAQDIIQQMNGPQAQATLEDFLKSQYEAIAISTYKKLDRHFDYLTDRACHGDLKALKRMQDLTARKADAPQEKAPLEVMLDRVFNRRAILKLKDDVDTTYDEWQYQFLRLVQV